jgi:hypothetical protein
LHHWTPSSALLRRAREMNTFGCRQLRGFKGFGLASHRGFRDNNPDRNALLVMKNVSH